jgi:peptidoglycan hydrolase-like protein with peptidoglycan-binding domain
MTGAARRTRRRFVTALAATTTGVASLALSSPAQAAPAAAPAASASPAAATPAVAAVPVAAVPVAAAAQPTLRSGSRGAAVTRLQQRLAALRYDVGTVDGAFGGDTLHAVYAFQKVQGMKVDGIVGPATWRKLAAPKVPKAKHKIKAAAVEVDLSRRVLYLTKGGKVTLIVDASPGKASTPTVRGNYKFSRRINGWRHAPLGKLWRPYYFKGGYAVHGSTSVPTYAASHGCVRVTTSAMNRLWTKFRIGQRIYVYR